MNVALGIVFRCEFTRFFTDIRGLEIKEFFSGVQQEF
jgi:hypothetical protein